MFALVWSVGATTDTVGREKFSNFIRSECKNNGIANPFPPEGLVYDYIIDLATGKWVDWLSTVEPHEIGANDSFAEMVIPTKDSIRNTFYWRNFYIGFMFCAFVPTGTGKTVNIEQYLMKGMSDRYVPLITSFSAQTSAGDAQKF